MKIQATMLAALLMLPGCDMLSGHERQAEDMMRTELGRQGEVKEVDFTQNGDNLTGFAIVRLTGKDYDSRFNCTARVENGQISTSCLEAINAEMERAMAQTVRASLERDGFTVSEVQLRRHNDDNHMKGFAQVRAPDGSEGRLECTAERQGQTANFASSCNAPGAQPASGAQEAAATDGGATSGGKPTGAEEAPVDEGFVDEGYEEGVEDGGGK